MKTAQTLWSDTYRHRHFLIPDDQQLPSGDFELRTLTGRQKMVAAESILAYEVSHDEAKIWLKDQFGQVVESAKTSIMDSIRNKMVQEPDLDAWFDQGTARYKSKPDTKDTSSSAQTGTSPAVSLFASLSGESLDQLQYDPQSAGRALQSIFTQLGNLLSDTTSHDEDRVNGARDRFQDLRCMLQQHGVNADKTMDDIPEKLRDAYHAAELKLGSDEIAQRLESLADSLDQATTHGVRWLRERANEVRQKQDKVNSPEKEDKQ